MYHWNIKFQEKRFTCKKVIQLWNFGNFGISEIIPKTLVTLRFLKVSLHEFESNCKCFQMRYWPIFYIHPTHNSTHFSTWPGRKITNAHDCTNPTWLWTWPTFFWFESMLQEYINHTRLKFWSKSAFLSPKLKFLEGCRFVLETL